MSTEVLSLINQLSPNEEKEVYIYVKELIDKRKENILETAKEAFYSIRESARKNGTMGMSLDEINKEIKLAREEIKRKKQGCFV